MACRTVKFKGGRTVRFCKKERTPKQKQKRANKARATLRAHVCPSQHASSFGPGFIAWCGKHAQGRLF